MDSGDYQTETHEELDYEPAVGVQNGFWSAGGMSFYLPDDQRADEAHSLTYTTDPLEQETRIFGWPRVVICASSSAEVATFVAKLSDVAPDGHSALIVDGSLNGTRRDSLHNPAPMEPDRVYELEIPMMPTAWILKPGHRLRLSISGSDFPNLWPTPLPTCNRLHFGGAYLDRTFVSLPIVPAASLQPPEFLPPPRLLEIVKSNAEPPLQKTETDQTTEAVSVSNRRAGTVLLEDGLGVLKMDSHFRCTASSRDPAKASIVGTHTYAFTSEGEEYEVRAESSIRATAGTFDLLIVLDVNKSGSPFFHREWKESHPRHLL